MKKLVYVFMNEPKFEFIDKQHFLSQTVGHYYKIELDKLYRCYDTDNIRHIASLLGNQLKKGEVDEDLIRHYLFLEDKTEGKGKTYIIIINDELQSFTYDICIESLEEIKGYYQDIMKLQLEQRLKKELPEMEDWKIKHIAKSVDFHFEPFMIDSNMN